MLVNQRFRFAFLAWGFCECLLLGGLMFGWGSLVYILKKDGVFLHLCPEQIPLINISVNGSVTQTEASIDGLDPSGCSEQDEMLSLAFTIGSSLFCIGCAVIGQVNYMYGTRVTRLIALTCLFMGIMFVAFTSQDMPWLLFPGLPLMGTGGITLLTTNVQFSRLFKRGSVTVVGLLSGATDSSSGVMLIVKVLHENGVPMRWSMLVLAGLSLLTLVNTFCFLPRDFILELIPEPDCILAPDSSTTTDNHGPTSATEHVANQATKINGNQSRDTQAQEVCSSAQTGQRLSSADSTQSDVAMHPTLLRCILSPVFILNVLWFSILQLRFYEFLNVMNLWLTSVAPQEVSYFTNVALYAMSCGVLVAPVAGFIFDVNRRLFAESRSQLRRKLMPTILPVVMTTLLGIGVSVLLMFGNVIVIYTTFVVVVLFRSFLYLVLMAYIRAMFPAEYLGSMYGISLIISGVIVLVQYGLFYWTKQSGFKSVNIFEGVLVTITLVHPIVQWIKCRRSEANCI